MNEQVHAEGADEAVRVPQDDAPVLAPSGPLEAQVLSLQRTIGNRAVGRLDIGRRVLARQPGASSGGGSKLVGLKYKVKWDDYQGKAGSSSSSSGTTIYARTNAQAVITFAGGKANAITGSAFDKSGGAYTLKNSVELTISLDKKQSWKNIGSLTDTQKQLLLEHEQGHYDITALFARDEFIEIMGLKSRSFPSMKEAGDTVVAIIKKYQALIAAVDLLYDDPKQTAHKAFESGSTKPAAQKKWEGYFETARTKHRTPEVQAPDGAYYKVPLAEVLRGAGHSI